MTPKKESLNREYYFGEKAEEYAKSKWMARNQLKSSRRSLELLQDDRIGGKLHKEPKFQLILDLGCGSGFSSQTIEGFGFHVIGLDNSFDMLLQNRESTMSHNRSLVCGLMEALPFRKHIFNHMISISSFNFILENVSDKDKREKLRKVSQKLSEILMDNGRCVIEFYPKRQNIDIYLESLKNFSGGMVIDNPNQRKEQKFLILRVRP